MCVCPLTFVYDAKMYLTYGVPFVHIYHICHEGWPIDINRLWNQAAKKEKDTTSLKNGRCTMSLQFHGGLKKHVFDINGILYLLYMPTL